MAMRALTCTKVHGNGGLEAGETPDGMKKPGTNHTGGAKARDGRKALARAEREMTAAMREGLDP